MNLLVKPNIIRYFLQNLFGNKKNVYFILSKSKITSNPDKTWFAFYFYKIICFLNTNKVTFTFLNNKDGYFPMI